MGQIPGGGVRAVGSTAVPGLLLVIKPGGGRKNELAASLRRRPDRSWRLQLYISCVASLSVREVAMCEPIGLTKLPGVTLSAISLPDASDLPAGPLAWGGPVMPPAEAASPSLASAAALCFSRTLFCFIRSKRCAVTLSFSTTRACGTIEGNCKETTHTARRKTDLTGRNESLRSRCQQTRCATQPTTGPKLLLARFLGLRPGLDLLRCEPASKGPATAGQRCRRRNQEGQSLAPRPCNC